MIISPHYFSWVSKMNADKLEKKQVVKEIENAIQTGFSIDTSHDEEFLKTANYSWEDLNKLKEDLGTQIVQFIGQVQEVITNPAIIQNLGEKTQHFNKVVELFFADINNFSFKVKDIRVLHEHLSGRIETMTDFNNYNRIAIQYQSLFSELATLITPTLADLMMTVTEIVPVNVVETAAAAGGEEQKGEQNV